MKLLFSILLAIVGITNANDIITSANSRNMTDCSKGGIYLNNSVELAMCWGDNEVVADFEMMRQGFVRVYTYPNTPDAYFYQGGLVFGSDVEFVRLLFREGELVEIYSAFKNIGSTVSYHSLSQTYEEFRDYFTDIPNGYKTIKDIPSNKVFQGQFSGCDGDCGSTVYDGKIVDVEVSLFMQGKAKQYAVFNDQLSVAQISVEVPQWDLVGNRGVDRFVMNSPYFTICFSEPNGTNARFAEKTKRRK